ncbi:MAG: hypothetical protein HQL15_06830, partial [Candidatus Omnitrophica bacterium]|nr:hypothetical protein [Candidatus Omnitrophota bacterium]
MTEMKKTNIYKLTLGWVLCCFFMTTILPVNQVYAQPALILPEPGTMLNVTPSFAPAEVKGITIHPENPLQFDFLIDGGDSQLAAGPFKEESNKIIKYFLAALTVPENDLWVNLSPYEKDRIIPRGLSDTEMGRDMLAQDYILKQLTASLIYPEKELGKTFWNTIYKQAQQKYGRTDIPVSTFNKVWILPDQAQVYEKGNSAFIVKSHMKVMLAEDYESLSKHNNSLLFPNASVGNLEHANPGSPTKSTCLPAGRFGDDKAGVHTIGSQMVRELILPVLEKEVNEGKNFASIRQIYQALILAQWYKITLKNSLLGQVYIDKNKTKGVDLDDKNMKEKIYKQYLKAFKKGVYNYIKEDKDLQTGETIPRKYFSGGLVLETGKLVRDGLQKASLLSPESRASVESELVGGGISDRDQLVTFNMMENRRSDGAMLSRDAIQTQIDAIDSKKNNLGFDLSTRNAEGGQLIVEPVEGKEVAINTYGVIAFFVADGDIYVVYKNDQTGNKAVIDSISLKNVKFMDPKTITADSYRKRLDPSKIAEIPSGVINYFASQLSPEEFGVVFTGNQTNFKAATSQVMPEAEIIAKEEELNTLADDIVVDTEAMKANKAGVLAIKVKGKPFKIDNVINFYVSEGKLYIARVSKSKDFTNVEFGVLNPQGKEDPTYISDIFISLNRNELPSEFSKELGIIEPVLSRQKIKEFIKDSKGQRPGIGLVRPEDSPRNKYSEELFKALAPEGKTLRDLPDFKVVDVIVNLRNNTTGFNLKGLLALAVFKGDVYAAYIENSEMKFLKILNEKNVKQEHAQGEYKEENYRIELKRSEVPQEVMQAFKDMSGKDLDAVAKVEGAVSMTYNKIRGKLTQMVAKVKEAVKAALTVKKTASSSRILMNFMVRMTYEKVMAKLEEIDENGGLPTGINFEVDKEMFLNYHRLRLNGKIISDLTALTARGQILYIAHLSSENKNKDEERKTTYYRYEGNKGPIPMEAKDLPKDVQEEFGIPEQQIKPETAEAPAQQVEQAARELGLPSLEGGIEPRDMNVERIMKSPQIKDQIDNIKQKLPSGINLNKGDVDEVDWDDVPLIGGKTNQDQVEQVEEDGIGVTPRIATINLPVELGRNKFKVGINHVTAFTVGNNALYFAFLDADNDYQLSYGQLVAPRESQEDSLNAVYWRLSERHLPPEVRAQFGLPALEAEDTSEDEVHISPPGTKVPKSSPVTLDKFRIPPPD